jgi:hypothetical protein
MRHDHGSYCKRCGKMKLAGGVVMKAWLVCEPCRAAEPAPDRPAPNVDPTRYRSGKPWLEQTFGRS